MAVSLVICPNLFTFADIVDVQRKDKGDIAELRGFLLEWGERSSIDVIAKGATDEGLRGCGIPLTVVYFHVWENIIMAVCAIEDCSHKQCKLGLL